MNVTGISLAPAAQWHSQQAPFTRAINKSTQGNVQASEIHYGAIAGPPVQRTAKAGMGSGGAAAGTNVRKVPVFIDGANVSQLCAYPADYYPMTGDVVKLILVGTDKKVRGHYLVMNRLASGQNPDHDVKTVVQNGTGGSLLTTSVVAILSYDPYAVFSLTSGMFRVSWSVNVGASGSILAQLVSHDGTTCTYGLSGTIAGTATETNFYSATAAAANIAGSSRTVKWSASVSGNPIVVQASSTVGSCYLAAMIEQVG